MPSASLKYTIKIDQEDITEDFDMLINVQKRLEDFGYSTFVPDKATGLAYLGFDPVTSRVVNVFNRSEAVNENSLLFAKRRDAIVIFRNSTYSSTSSKIEGTDRFISAVGQQTVQRPAWYRHSLPDTAIAAKINKTTNSGGFTPVSPYDYIVDLSSSNVFTAVRNIYNSTTGEYVLYYVDITLNDNSIKRELLGSDPTLHEATIDDLNLDTGELFSDTGAYTVEEVGDNFYYIFASASKKAVRERATARLFPILDKNLALDDSWFLSIANGSFTRIYNSVLYSYFIREYDNQDFIPYAPFKLQIAEVADVIARNTIKVNREVQLDTSNGLHIDIVIKDTKGRLKAALSSNEKATERTDYTWSVSTFSVDSKLGIIALDAGPVGLGDYVEVTYYYNADLYEFTTIDLNPHQNQGIEEYMVVYYLVPDVGLDSQSIHWLKVDKNNIIVEASQNEGSYTGNVVFSWPIMSHALSSGLCNPNTVVGDEYRNYGASGSGLDFWIDKYSVENVNQYQYLILAEITFTNPYTSSDMVNIDSRVKGGGIRMNKLKEALKASPFLQYTASEVGVGVEGIPYSGYFAGVVRVPYTLLEEYGGSWKLREIVDKLYTYSSPGTYHIVELTGVIPRICSINIGKQPGEIDIEYAKESDRHQFNFYISQSWDGPWMSTNNANTLYNQTPITPNYEADCSVYTLSNLDPGVKYKVAVTAVNILTNIESPPSVIYEVESASRANTQALVS